MTTNIKPKNKNEFNRDCWSTPQWLFSWLDSIYIFDVDLCASKENAKCVAYFNQDDNSLIQSWHNHQGFIRGAGFCNPPYSKIKPWIAKAIKEAKQGFTTSILIPTPNGESYYKDIFDNATVITFINGRIAFVSPCDYTIKGKMDKKTGKLKPDRHIKKGDDVPGNTRGSCIVEFSPKYASKNIEINHVDRDSLIKEFG